MFWISIRVSKIKSSSRVPTVIEEDELQTSWRLPNQTLSDQRKHRKLSAFGLYVQQQ